MLFLNAKIYRCDFTFFVLWKIKKDKFIQISDLDSISKKKNVACLRKILISDKKHVGFLPPTPPTQYCQCV